MRNPVVLPSLCALLLALVAAGAAGAQTGRKAAQAEADLKEVKAEIAKIAAQVKRDSVDRNKLTRNLRAAEVSVADARAELARLRGERAERTARRAALARDRADRVAALEAEQQELGNELRGAYLIGREEPLKLLLNQEDPARAGRMFAYYSYFGRARADRIAGIRLRVAEIAALDARLEEEEARLTGLESQQKSQLGRLEAARTERSRALAELESESRSRAATLAQLRSEQGALEKLVRELRRALEQFPVDATAPFAKLRGKLAWPAAGKLVATYGTVRAGAIKWDGVMIATERGAPVHSIASGRIAYADWLPGLGLLTIVDHGGGYLSLYGHNDQLYKAVGERVAPGDTIAAAGDSGGRSRPELYFEIRRGGKPIDPAPWFRQARP
ncbi:MAG: Murein hydrolase activator EnvC [Steroidobacteraceae bacterium]|nr:Murein hydrolase activator EnvC [Steroidobacteraceae bacterium]